MYDIKDQKSNHYIMTKNVNVICIMSSSRECGQKLTAAG